MLFLNQFEICCFVNLFFGCSSRWILMQSWLVVLTASLDSRIDVEQEIKVGPGKFGKKNKCRTIKLENLYSIWKKIPNQ